MFAKELWLLDNKQQCGFFCFQRHKDKTASVHTIKQLHHLLSSYIQNYCTHTTFGDWPEEIRNRLVATLHASQKMRMATVQNVLLQIYGKRLAPYSLGRHSKPWGSIAGNHMSLPIQRINAAEGVVLRSYRIDRVAQLYGGDDLNGCIDLNMNGFEVEGGLFTEELVIRYPLLVTKCNSLRGHLQGRDSLWALPSRALPQNVPQWTVQQPASQAYPPSYFTSRVARDTSPCPPQIYSRIQKSA